MAFITGTDRNQQSFGSLDELVGAESEVRIIDTFVASLNLAQLNFNGVFGKENCRPQYHPALLLKVYLYGYINGIRSSRKLQAECERNIEMKWLCNNLVPKYHTIADFRKDHPDQIKNIFRQFVFIMKGWDLLGCKTIGVDGTKFRAQNSRKNNYNEKKIERHLNYIDTQTAEYLDEMNRMDKEERKSGKMKKKMKEITGKLEKLEERKKMYEALQKDLNDSGEYQVSTSDPESKAMVIRGSIIEVAYNTQTAVDDKNNLIVHYDTTNNNDLNALSKVAVQAKENLQLNGPDELIVLADKGYMNGGELSHCKDENIKTYVALKTFNYSGPIPTRQYYVDQFTYNKENDSYTCPQGNVLNTNGNWYLKHGNDSGSYKIKHYKTSACLTCPVMKECTLNKKGRLIERSQYQEAVDENAHRMRTEKEKYLQRQCICEHPFGTIKRQWGYTYTLMRTKRKVNADMGLIFLCYNLKRVIKILGFKKLMRMLKKIKGSPLPLFKTDFLEQFTAHSIFFSKINFS